MSRWLKSVNNILEKLDDRVETAAEDASQVLIDADGAPVSGSAFSGFKSRFLGNDQQNQSEDGSYYDDEDDDAYYEDEDDEEEPEENDVEVEEEESPELVDQDNVPFSEKTRDTDQQLDTEKPQSTSRGPLDTDLTKETAKSETEVKSSVEKEVSKAEESIDRVSKVDLPKPPAPPSSQSSARAVGKPQSRLELQTAQQEMQRLAKLNASLQAQLDASKAELSAQTEELLKAAERIEEDRQLADEEREELMEEHEEALRNLKSSYEARLEHQKDELESQIQDLLNQLATESEMRAKEGGDMTEELSDSIERERHALQKVDQLEQEKSQLEQTNARLIEQETSLREEVKNLKEATQASLDRERQMEERLDTANEMHQRALSQRQAREAELERTVADLGAALALKKPTGGMDKANVTANVSHYEKKYGFAIEELESTKAQLALANQKCEALQQELRLLSFERTEEAAVVQEKERQYDSKVEQLTSKIAELEAALREYKAAGGDMTSSNTDVSTSGESVAQLNRDLENARRHITSLSDQLLRQQGLTESAKSEALALRGRLQSANSRAEAAEAAGSNNAGMLELESGGVGFMVNSRQRRIRRMGPQRGRTMRSALGLRTMEGSNFEQIAQTVDAVDLWMLQTGVILKHEPLARIGLLFYFTLIHVWCFGLVFFHAVESEHGDLSELRSRRNDHFSSPNIPP